MKVIPDEPAYVPLWSVSEDTSPVPLFPLTRGNVWSFTSEVEGLILDTGAGANVAGDRVLQRHYERVLRPLGEGWEIHKEEAHGNFSGINGPPLSSDEQWTVYGFLGAGTGATAYEGYIFPESDLPALTSLNSVRTGEGALLTREDALYMPDDLGSEVYYKFPLHYTGTHYVLPFDKIPKEDDPPPVKYGRMEEVLEEYPDGTSKVWMTCSIRLMRTSSFNPLNQPGPSAMEFYGAKWSASTRLCSTRCWAARTSRGAAPRNGRCSKAPSGSSGPGLR